MGTAKHLASLAFSGMLAALSLPLNAAEKTYSLAEHGISATFPVKPVLATSASPVIEGQTTSYRALDENTARQYTIFVGQPAERGIYETESMDAFLEGHLKSIVSSSVEGKVLESKRITFLGMPALSYTFQHKIEGVPFTGKGVTFMIDGGHMRLSVWFPSGDKQGPKAYERFVQSFKLLPIAYRSGQRAVSDPRGFSFRSPMGWKREEPRTAYDIARFRNLTRSMALLAAGQSAYSCGAYKAELDRAGAVLETSSVNLNGRSANKILTYEDVPKYNVRLTTVHYCLDSKLGAVVLTGTEEQSMFWRWASVFEGAAASIQLPR